MPDGERATGRSSTSRWTSRRCARGWARTRCGVRTYEALEQALAAARRSEKTCAVVVEVDLEKRVPGYESWWDVPIAEVSEIETVRQARAGYEIAVQRERRHEIDSKG